MGGAKAPPFVLWTMYIVAGMACMPDRWPASLRVMLSLKKQVDTLFLSLNGFAKTPPELLDEDWIKVSHIGHNVGDIGKFADVECDFYLSCDDDLIYPPTYVADFIKAADRFPGHVLTHHGNDAKGPTNSYFKMRYGATRIQCLMRNDKEIPLTIPGTGVTFYPGEVYSELYSRLFDGWNHADLIVGKILQDMDVPLTALKHHKHYFQYLEPPKGATIWEQNVKWDKKMTDIWNTIGL